jgi:1,4-alpha-glucan branching enzyme
LHRNSSIGYHAIVLHAHLPYVRHPEYADCLEERWLFEAIAETYLPLMIVIDAWERDQVDYRLTLSISPTLAAMLADPLLRGRFERHLRRLQKLAEFEVMRTKLIPKMHIVALHNRDQIQLVDWYYREVFKGDMLGALRHYGETGRLELITCQATHGFLPLLQPEREISRIQIRTALAEHERQFGRRPRGMWISECGYYPGLDQVLADEGVEYFFVDAHGVLKAGEPALRGTYAPVQCPAGPAAFARDMETSHAVWDAKSGYPADGAYREFYRDTGYDLDFETVRPYIHDSGIRVATGLRYHRVTSPEATLDEKAFYDPAEADRRAWEHAQQFVRNRVRQVNHWARAMTRKPLVTSPYDAELFGHWWYEGPRFLDYVMRQMARGDWPVAPITPGGYLDRYSENQILQPCLSSWGEGGYASMWLHPRNEWIYPPLHEAGERALELALKHKGTKKKTIRGALNHLLRELMLAQSSDWAFMMKVGATADYGERRTREHLRHCRQLTQMLAEGRVNKELLEEWETAWPIFPELQFENMLPETAKKQV